jgi:hypothetical protein
VGARAIRARAGCSGCTAGCVLAVSEAAVHAQLTAASYYKCDIGRQVLSGHGLVALANKAWAIQGLESQVVRYNW